MRYSLAMLQSPSAKDLRSHYFLPLASLLLLLLSAAVAAALLSSPRQTRHTQPLSTSILLSSSPYPAPSFAYLLSGTDGDGDRLLRLLRAVYHPSNVYLLHLDGAAGQDQRVALAEAVRSDAALRSGPRNVHVVGRADVANTRGSSALAATLHGAAVLLRMDRRWNWFVNLGAAQYPLVTPDDLLHVFSFLPKDLNFVEHSSYIGWRESRRLKPIIIDPGLYDSSKIDVFYATQQRELPNAFRLFTGSPSVILSRKFVEYSILGADNLARSLLMYYANTPSSHTSYFQTVLCNSPQFNQTVVNHDLHYKLWDSDSRRDPRVLTHDDFKNLSQSCLAFATPFSRNDSVLELVDKDLLNRGPSRMVPGGWCLGTEGDPCGVRGDANVLRPSGMAITLAKFLAELLSDDKLHSNQCIW